MKKAPKKTCGNCRDIACSCRGCEDDVRCPGGNLKCWLETCKDWTGKTK
jgi:hypothetical protein